MRGAHAGTTLPASQGSQRWPAWLRAARRELTPHASAGRSVRTYWLLRRDASDATCANSRPRVAREPASFYGELSLEW